MKTRVVDAQDAGYKYVSFLAKDGSLANDTYYYGSEKQVNINYLHSVAID